MKLPIAFRTRDPRAKYQVYFRASPTGMCVIMQRALCPVLAQCLGNKVLEEISQVRVVTGSKYSAA